MLLSTLRRGTTVLRPSLNNLCSQSKAVYPYRWLSTVPTGGGDDPDDKDDESPAETPIDPTDSGEGSESSTNVLSADLEKNLRPSDVVKELNRHIVGQQDAKRAVAIAMRNRWRRRQLTKEMRKEVTPRNVLMIGPTGCGKTEVARRMADLSDAPFLKVEATKFTEVGYHGRDVDQIIRDLMDVSMTLTKKRKTEQFREEAKGSVEERILDLLVGDTKNRSKAAFRTMLRDGHLEDELVFVDVPKSGGEKDAPVFFSGESNNPNIAALSELYSHARKQNKSTERKQLPIKEAREILLDVELERLLENIDLKKEAILSAEESGIVFIDEIDKICNSRDAIHRGGDASAEGVQRDLLPLVEGTTISTKYGNVNTDYILFVASGAFHAVKPSDMLPELQGRLPIRVELNGLTEDDLYKILTEPVANLIQQQKELIATEGVDLVVEEEAIREIARMAAMLNKTVENIGARRLHTVIERIMEELSFDAAEKEEGTTLTVDKNLVEDRLSEIVVKSDLSRYIL